MNISNYASPIILCQPLSGVGKRTEGQHSHCTGHRPSINQEHSIMRCMVIFHLNNKMREVIRIELVISIT